MKLLINYENLVYESTENINYESKKKSVKLKGLPGDFEEDVNPRF